MNPIRMENKQGKCVGLVLQHKSEHIISEDKLKQLYPYIGLISTFGNAKHADIKDRFKIVKLSDTQAALAIDGAGEEDLRAIRDICQEKLSEQLIVPQEVDMLPMLRHRVMQFDIENNQLVGLSKNLCK